MRWPFLRGTRQRKQSDAEAVEALLKFPSSDALFNRAAMNPATLNLYRRMLEAASKTPDKADGMRLSGQLFHELVNTLAQEAGKPVPKTPQDAVCFLENELKGFDTPAAKERREREVANALLNALGIPDKT
jgi:hypothetical protein